MSWPADGLPRFVVSENHGWREPKSTSWPPGVTCTVLDRAFNHARVAAYVSEETRVPRGEKIDVCRRQANGHAYRLNLEHSGQAGL